MSQTAAGLFANMRFTGQWRDYQQRVIEEYEAHFADDRLHLVAAPGSGKTVLGLELVRRLGRRTIVLAPTRIIRDQWSQRWSRCSWPIRRRRFQVE